MKGFSQIDRPTRWEQPNPRHALISPTNPPRIIEGGLGAIIRDAKTIVANAGFATGLISINPVSEEDRKFVEAKLRGKKGTVRGRPVLDETVGTPKQIAARVRVRKWKARRRGYPNWEAYLREKREKSLSRGTNAGAGMLSGSRTTNPTPNRARDQRSSSTP